MLLRDQAATLVIRPPASHAHLWHDALWAGAGAAIVSGIPSTLHAWWTGGDVMEATRAAGAMLIPADSSDRALFVSAAIVHGTISLFWATVLAFALPRRRILMWSVVAAAGIALLDLRLIGWLFPEIYELPFWPQFADHLAWGTAVGWILDWRSTPRAQKQRSVPPE